MTEEQVKGLFVLAGIQVTKLHKLENKYWPNHPDYLDVRAKSPWWLVMTPHGPIEIGWRKRVISISWEDTSTRVVPTSDAVTKSETYVHAYSYPKALEYLTVIAAAMSRKEVTP